MEHENRLRGAGGPGGLRVFPHEELDFLAGVRRNSRFVLHLVVDAIQLRHDHLRWLFPSGTVVPEEGSISAAPEPYGEPGRRGAQMVTDRVGPAPPIGGAHSGERTGDRNTAWKTAVDVLTSTRSASRGERVGGRAPSRRCAG